MKSLLLTLITLTFILSAKAQKSDTLKGLAADTLLFYKTEHAPEFPGGFKQYYKYLHKNLKWPDGSVDVQGSVIVSFVVEKDGTISHAKIIKSLQPLFDTEALRVISNMPKWNPANQNGHIVRCFYALPVTFKMNN